MATALTYYTELQEPTVNGDVDLWGAILNSTNAAWDRALAGLATASLAGGDWTPTTSEGECLVLKATGVLGTNRTIFVPAKYRRYVVWNATTGAFSVTIKTAAGTGYVCPQGQFTDVYCDSLDMYLRASGGTSGLYPIGTSGATVPLNNGNNTSSGSVTYSGTSSFTNTVTMSGGSGSPLTLQWSDDGATAGPAVNMTRISTTPAASDLLGLWNFRGRDSGGNDTIYGRVQAQIVDATDTSEDGALVWYTMQAGTLTAGLSQRLGVFMAGTTDQGVGTINATGLYQGGVALGTAAFVNTGTSGATVPLLNAPSTFSGGLWIFDGSTGTVTPVQIKYSDAAAGAGPILNLFRDSATPAASDAIGQVTFRGRDSGANTADYAYIRGVITDPTDTSEDGEVVFGTFVAGTSANRIQIGGGIYSTGVTGGDKGAGTLNFTTIYEGGTLLAAKYAQLGVGATFTQPMAITLASAGGLQITAADDGAGGTPDLSLIRTSASPAASDVLGRILLYGLDSGANQTVYASIQAKILDATDTSEDGALEFRTMVAGSAGTRFAIAQGLYTVGQSDMGTNTINATTYYKAGAALKVTVQVLTGSGTYTPTSGATYAIVELVGGGGGGGGADAASSSDWGGSGGGGGGGYSRSRIALSGTYSYAVGAAGTAGSNTGGNGGTGGTTTFGTGPLLQATGGSGGTGSKAGGGDPGGGGGAGGVGSGGDFNAEGQGGGSGFTGGTPGAISGAGGSSMLGGGGRGQYRNSTSSGVLAGATGGNYGGGGGGAVNIKTTAGTTGGAGAAGVIIVTEFTV